MDINEYDTDGERLTRRASLARLGGLVAVVVGAGGAASEIAEGATDDSARSDGPAGVASGAISCILAPEQTAGPYYLPGDAIRRTITEGRRGVPLALRLAVVDASTCKSIKGAAVDIWHCDAAGVYSGTSDQGTEDDRFLRGIQRTDAKGIARFNTLYPGYYPGRTVHIHVNVALGGNIVHTGQLYFPDALTDTVYKRAPYNARPAREMRNPDDSIYRNGGSRSTLRLRGRGLGYVGSITMGVMRG
jgi:protocatechuate 3,4-dioxygenase beta subunit